MSKQRNLSSELFFELSFVDADFTAELLAFSKETRKFEARDIYTQNHIAGLYHTPTENIDIAKEYVTKRNLNNDWC